MNYKDAEFPKSVSILADIKRKYLKWFGIIGISLLVLERIDTIIRIAQILKFIAEQWRQWSYAFWTFWFSLFHVQITPEAAILMNLLAFLSMIVFGTRRGHPQHRNHAIYILAGTFNILTLLIIALLMVGSLAEYHHVSGPILDDGMLPNREQLEAVEALTREERWNWLIANFRANWQSKYQTIIGTVAFYILSQSLFSLDQYALFANVLKIIVTVMLFLVMNFIVLHATL